MKNGIMTFVINLMNKQMNTIQTLQFKALSLKATIDNQFGSDLVDHFIDKNPEEIKKAMRNICAFISPELFERVEVMCSNLSISKRQVVEMALNDFMEKADKVIDDIDPFANVALSGSGEPIATRSVEGA
jgi:uncharacterized membrane protein (DUF373 family)